MALVAVSRSIVIGCLVALSAVLYYYELLFVVFTLLAHLAIAALGIYLGVSWTLIRGKQYIPPPLPRDLQHLHANIVLQNMMEAQAVPKAGLKKVVISRNMDLALKDVIDLVLRDFVSSWYKDLSVNQDALLSHLQSDLWVMIENFSERLSKIDTVKFVTQEVVNSLKHHFQAVRLASKRGAADGAPQSFALQSWLRSEEDEIAFLRQVSEVLLVVVLPKHHAKSPPIRHLLREVVAKTVLKPMIDLMCDPDYINMKLIEYIEYREKLSEDTRRTYTYAATYEDFVKMIEKCEDIESLKQLRFNIMTEIMQATTINNLKKSSDKPGSPKGGKGVTAKGELLKARNLKRYINQLTVAKARCEKRICGLGGPDYKYYTEDADEGNPGPTRPGKTVFSYQTIMASAMARDYFKTFLQRDDCETLMEFWNAVERMKELDKRQHHHLAQEIYQRYVASTGTAVRVDKALMKGMETFMKGDSASPEAFFEAQAHVGTVLQERHYPSFVVSDVYHRYITSLDDGAGEANSSSGKDELFFEVKEDWLDDDEEEMFSAQSYHAQQKLQQLDLRITNKSQALDALRTSSRADPKIQKVDEELDRELEGMKIEKRNLESHIMRTETWCENVGKWRAHVYEAETTLDRDKRVPIFVLVIHLSGSSTMSQNLQNSTHGWVVTRRLQDFYNVHEKLVQIAGSWLKNKELPKVGTFTTVDQKFLKEAKATLNEYLTVIMKDERLAQSEALYGFLTPTPEYFQQPGAGTGKKSGFFLKNILKNLPSIGQDNRDADDDLVFSGDERNEDRSKDSIAEPLYGLINEVYELHGMFKWLRKSFISFVETTFGRSINRQLRETVYWIFSEPMIIYYIRNFKDSMWPNGVLADSLPTRTDEEKQRTRLKAKEKFLLIQPDAVKTLVGDENARRGTIKMFEVLQDVRLNKHLFYVLLLLILDHMVPELEASWMKEGEPEDAEDPVVGSVESTC